MYEESELFSVFPISMEYFSVLLLLSRYCYFFLAVPYFSEGVYLWLFITFSLFFFTLYFFISFLFSLFISFLLGCSLVLVQVKQVRGFYRVFIMKNKGDVEFVHWRSNHKKKNE